jgi:pimeloyl-ACP methyl ester carboxylesterase
MRNIFITLSRSSALAKALAALALVIGAASLGLDGNAHASAVGLVEKGRGPALVFIPGLISGRETFTETCEAFVAKHRCLLLDLPGFAGQRPIDVQRGFFSPVESQIMRLLRDNHVSKATLVGHSLGGVLAMLIALDAPDLVDRLVLVDSLPFYPATQNPALTVELMKPQAEQMRAQMNAVSDEDFVKITAQSATRLSNTAARQGLLTEWSRTSDRATTTAAMVDLMTTDLRARISGLSQSVLVLGSWAAYKQYGSTLESTKAIFRAQYAALPGVDIRISQTGYHFLTWDDGAWVDEQIRDFLIRTSGRESNRQP